MTINNAHRYLEGVWDWAILDGCFGETKVKPMDIDGLIERNGHKLFIETKAPGVALPDSSGQMIALRSLVKDGHAVMILWGKQNRPERMRLLTPTKDQTATVTLDQVRTIVRQWYAYANRTPYRPTAKAPKTVEPIETGEIDSMSSYQQITILGNLGNDPEMRYTPSGTPVTSFNVAVSRQWVGADGEKKEKVTWFRVSAWGNQAQPCADFLYKGAKVMVVGEVEEARTYTDRDGNARASLEVKAQTVQFLDRRPDDSAPARAAHRTAQPAATGADEDIPF